MSTLKTHNLQSPDAGSVNITLAPNAGVVVAGLSTYSNQINVGSNIKLGTAGVVTATSFVGGLPITSGANNRIITASSASAIQGETGLTYDGSQLVVRGSDSVTGSGGTKTVALRGGDADSDYVNLSFDTGAGGPLAVIAAKADSTGVYPNTTGSLRFSTQVGGGLFDRLRIASDGKIDLGGSTFTGNAARLTITHTNNSGVGLIDIDSYGSATLQIRSNWSGSTINGMPNETFGFGTPHAYPLVFTTSGSERLRIDSSGLLGLGTNNPSSFNAYAKNLVVAKSSGDAGITISAQDASSEYGSLHFAGGTTVRAYIDQQNGTTGRMFLMNKANGYMGLGTNNTERVRIGSSGQIGLAGANYGTARQTIVSNGSGSAVTWSSNPFLLDMDSLGDIDYDGVFLRYREVNVTGNGLVYLGLCKSTTNCPAGRIGIPVGYIPGAAYNAHFRVDKVGITPWPDGSGHRYEFYAIISDYASAGKLGIFYLTNSTN